MRRQGHYGDPSANTSVGGQMHHMVAGPRGEAKSGNFEGRLEAFTPERENPYANSKPEGQWRWEMDESKMSNSMTSRMFSEASVSRRPGYTGLYYRKSFQTPKQRGTVSCSSVGQGVDASKSYFQGQGRSNNDSRSQAHEEDMDVGYEGNHLSQTFEGLEQNFRDDIIKLTKEQNDAEDAEYARHREKINAINAQYEEKLAALRAQHSNRRAEFLQREAHARQQQYQQFIRDPYPSSGMAPRDPHGFNNSNAPGVGGEVQRGYSADHFDPYRERARFLGAGRDQGFEPRGPYPGGRVYDTGSRYYN